jgi:3-hydroxyisobutyrate dehydrogenase
MSQKLAIAFLGLGLMGAGMARRLLEAGHPLSVYNRDRAKAAPLAAAGARLAGSAGEAAHGADIVIAMVSDDLASRAIWFGADGALPAAKPGALLIESSTISVGWVKELAAAASARQCELLDAPVTGSRVQAASGELLFIVGGSTEAVERAAPMFAAMGRGVTHLGPTGSGALLKLINNFLCGVQATALAEAVALIERSGLDRDKAVDVITNGAPGSPLLKAFAGRMTKPDFSPHFLLRLMAKDLRYACEEGARHGVEMSTVAGALAVLLHSVAAGDGEKDASAVVERFRR